MVESGGTVTHPGGGGRWFARRPAEHPSGRLVPDPHRSGHLPAPNHSLEGTLEPTSGGHETAYPLLWWCVVGEDQPTTRRGRSVAVTGTTEGQPVQGRHEDDAIRQATPHDGGHDQAGDPALPPRRLPCIAGAGDRGGRPARPGDQHGHRGEARRRPHRDHRAPRRGAPAPRGRPGCRQDDARQDAGPLDRLLGATGAVHPRPAAQRHHRCERLQPGRARLRVPPRCDLRQRRRG